MPAQLLARCLHVLLLEQLPLDRPHAARDARHHAPPGCSATFGSKGPVGLADLLPDTLYEGMAELDFCDDTAHGHDLDVGQGCRGQDLQDALESEELLDEALAFVA